MMAVTTRAVLARAWPWLGLMLLVAWAVGEGTIFPSDTDLEFPLVVRPTFSMRPPPAYRLAEPGDTLDHLGLYFASAGIVLTTLGMIRARRAGQPVALWPAALAVFIALFWYVANPWPTFDGWHGLGWPALGNPRAPQVLRIALLIAAIGLAGAAAIALWSVRKEWPALWQAASQRRCLALLTVASVLIVLRLCDVPRIEPLEYWPRWFLAWGVLALVFAVIRALPQAPPARWRPLIAGGAIGTWAGLVAAGFTLMWIHRPLERFKEVVPGKIYISAMPTYRGLEVVQARHHFKTILDLFPEDSDLRSPTLPDEIRFAREHGILLVTGTSKVAEADAFLDRTLALAQSPDAWPILVHCHGCMDRTPAWVGIYRFLYQGWPLADVLREIEQHRGYRPKASVTLLYNRVLMARAPERYRADPTAQLLFQCASRTADPYYQQLRDELRKAQAGSPHRVSRREKSTRTP